jgi:uncharacterized protein (TIGR03437 family)
MYRRFRVFTSAFLPCLLAAGTGAAATNIVVNGNFAGGTQQPPGPGPDTVANNWIMLPATATDFQIQNIGGNFYAAFMSTVSASDQTMNGIGIPNGNPDMDCLYQPLTLIAGHQYTVSFSVTVTGAVGNNTLLIPQWNWSPQVGTQINMMDPLYGDYNATQAEFSAASRTGSVTETFTETAPVGAGVPAGATEVVNLMFHGSDVTGGAILLTNVVVSEAPTPPAPSIFSGGVVPIFSSSTSIEPGEWVSIFGTNLASGNVIWTGSFTTSLGGTSVTINGNAAYLSSVSPGQINLQAPSDTATGTVPVVVTTGGGTVTSAVTLAQFAPSFNLLDTKHVAGIILRSDGSGAYGGGTYDIIGPTGVSIGYPTVAVKAGDTVELFGTGFGPTTPSAQAGEKFTGAAPTNAPVTVTINGVSVTPLFAGLSGAGLYQINVTIPTGLGTGDVPLIATVGSVQTPSSVVISLQ